MDKKIVLKWFNKYPDLEKFIGAGTISLKMAREIIDVDRYFMYDIYKELVVAEAVTPCGNNSFRATKELREFLRERREEKKNENN